MNHLFLVGNWVSSCFHPLFPERLHCCCYIGIYFHCSYLYNTIISSKPYALKAEFQHFIPRFNKKTSLLLRTSVKEGMIIMGERRPKDRVKTGWL
jgi:hypothetical protein